MISDIKYSGLSTVPADSDSPDGQLDIAINVLNESGSLSPIEQPKVLLQCTDKGSVVGIHHTSTEDNYIITRPIVGTRMGVYYIRKAASIKTDEDATLLLTVDGYRDIAFVGNTIIVASSTGLSYILWKDGHYTNLGERPPMLPIELGLRQADRAVTPVRAEFFSTTDFFTGPYYDSLGNAITYRGTALKVSEHESRRDDEKLLNTLMGTYLKKVNELVFPYGHFYQPFFIRYALRLYDGSYIYPSAPILLLPSANVPLFEGVPGEWKHYDNYWDETYSGGDTIGSCSWGITTNIHLPYHSIAYRLVDERALDAVKEWKDVIAGVDFFISDPIYTFDQNGAIIQTYEVGEILKNFPVTDNEAESTIVDSTTPMAANDEYIGASLSFHNPLMMESLGGCGDPWAESQTDNKFTDKIFKPENHTANEDKYFAWVVRRNKQFHSQIKSQANYYLIASKSIDDLTVTGTNPKLLDLDSKNTNPDYIRTRPKLPECDSTHVRYIPNKLFAYNNRLSIAAGEMCAVDPLPLEASMPTRFDLDNPNAVSNVEITIWSRHNGVVTSATSSQALPFTFNLRKDFPRWYFHPDPYAFAMRLRSVQENLEVTIPLKPHDFLSGAYYWGGLSDVHTPTITTTIGDYDIEPTIPQLNKLCVSEIDNPFLFPSANACIVGTGEIRGISTAAIPLSQGQFGQFPLYAFCSDGVWALEVSSTGTYSAKQPVSRDVCNNPSSITQLNQSVAFATERGVMRISGNQVECLTEAIQNDPLFDKDNLALYSQLRNSLGLTNNDYPMSFHEFVSDCGLVYDNLNQRIILYNPMQTYAYVYSLQSGLWGMMYSEFAKTVNAYPLAAAMGTNSQLVTLQRKGLHNGATMPALFLTRPLKLDNPDVLKTVSTIIQRGHFRRGHVKCVLYGSRDLDHWHVIWSSQDHYLRGFRGTPYKYFRMAVIANLDQDESITGATVDYTPRQTNRLR